jgi:toxin ParE1/3/4
MKRYALRLGERAEADLGELYAYLSLAASPSIARGYVDRLMDFIEGLRYFPHRGTIHDDLRADLRLIGFERRVTVAFIVEEDTIKVVRLFYGGRSFDSDDLQ